MEENRNIGPDYTDLHINRSYGDILATFRDAAALAGTGRPLTFNGVVYDADLAAYECFHRLCSLFLSAAGQHTRGGDYMMYHDIFPKMLDYHNFRMWDRTLDPRLRRFVVTSDEFRSVCGFRSIYETSDGIICFVDAEGDFVDDDTLGTEQMWHLTTYFEVAMGF